MNETSPYRSLATLRAMAKGQLLGRYRLATATSMTVFMMSLLLGFFASSLFDFPGVAGYLADALCSFLVSLPLGIIHVGVFYMALKICCREEIRIQDLYFGFRHHPEKTVKIQAVLSGAFTVAMLPAGIVRAMPAPGGSDYGSMAAAFYAAGFIAYGFVALVLSQVFFLLLDFGDKSVRELLSMSQTLMEGQKKRLFLLWLSFVPLLLLSALSCGAGFIWVMPYICVASANFYMDMMQADT